jgi:hypothetical protein
MFLKSGIIFVWAAKAGTRGPAEEPKRWEG